jgi:ABC-type Fe3+-siderophore transport system permease subunit
VTTKPSRREILRPAELLGISAGLGLFVGLAVLFTTRTPLLALVFFGVAFIVSCVVVAMLLLTFKPNKDELVEIDEDNKTPPPPITPSAH